MFIPQVRNHVRPWPHCVTHMGEICRVAIPLWCASASSDEVDVAVGINKRRDFRTSDYWVSDAGSERGRGRKLPWPVTPAPSWSVAICLEFSLGLCSSILGRSRSVFFILPDRLGFTYPADILENGSIFIVSVVAIAT